MIRRAKRPVNQHEVDQSVSAAKRFIALFHHVSLPNEEQLGMLARAHYTLAYQSKLSFHRCKMHVNSAITVLQTLQLRKKEWPVQIALAYFKRAELFEEEKSYIAASHDYQRAIDILGQNEERHQLTDRERLLIAQCAISIADLAVNDQINPKKINLSHPLFYVNKALGYLGQIPIVDDDIWTTHAYAHLIAGIALGSHDFDEALKALRMALSIAFKTDPFDTGFLLSDIYSCLGLLYEQQYLAPIQKNTCDWIEHAMVYFGMALLYSTNESIGEEDNLLGLESLFEIIYRVLDPYLPSLSKHVIYDLIDGLTHAYLGIVDEVLPNRSLRRQLSHPETLETFVQHIYWLVLEAHHRNHRGTGLLDISDPEAVDLSLDIPEMLQTLYNNVPDNILYLKRPMKLSAAAVPS